MNKLVFLLVAFSSAIIADRPEWYPENAEEIEGKCLEQHPITADQVANVQQRNLVNTPEMRAVAFCAATGKNVFRLGVGFEPERFARALKYAFKVDCKIDFIRECAEKHKDLKPEESMFFHTAKCIIDDEEHKCSKIDVE